MTFNSGSGSIYVFIPGWYVVSFDGSDPFIKWQLERGLDWTISSVAGESYRVDVSLWVFFAELITAFNGRIVLFCFVFPPVRST